MKPRLYLTALAIGLGAVAVTPSLASATPATGPTSPTAATSPTLGLAIPGAKAGSSADISTFLTGVLTDVDAYWTRIFKAHNIAEPTVSYDWIPSGQSVIDGCSHQPTDDTAAFYCPSDDTIYLSEDFAAAVRDGKIQGWPSGDTTNGALGDMAVAYVIAHEEAHNIQAELGITDANLPTSDFELQADCMAGAWAGDAAKRGVVDASDVNIAESTAWLVGDYEVDNPGHHGTPEERRQAFTNGYANLSSCEAYVPGS